MFVVEMYAQVRRIRLDARLSSPRRPPKHRVRCQRMPRAGMLIQLDGSYHRWLADHIPPFTLLLAVDDALFWEPEDSRNYFPCCPTCSGAVAFPSPSIPTATRSSSTIRNISPLGRLSMVHDSVSS